MVWKNQKYLSDLPGGSGTYVVIFELEQAVDLPIASLGSCHFLPGNYFYCGSAKGAGGIRSRVLRHFDPDTISHWHIDYFKKYANPVCAWFSASLKICECDYVTLLEAMDGFRHLIAGFGASDCKNGCTSHLLHKKGKIDINSVFKEMKNHLSHKNTNLNFGSSLLR